MLATAQRLRRRGEFAAAIRAGHRAARGVLVVHLMPPEPGQPEQQHPDRPHPEARNLVEPARTQVRAGFVVPRSVGGAVERNRVKRRLRHLVRERLAQLPAGSDVVIRALPGAADRGYPRLASDLDAAPAAARRRKPARR